MENIYDNERKHILQYSVSYTFEVDKKKVKS